MFCSPLSIYVFIISYFSIWILKFLFLTFNGKWYLEHKIMPTKKKNLEEVFRCVGLNAMQLSCFLLLFLIPLYSSNLHISPLGSPLLIISHHSQFTWRNNNWSSIQQHIQWRQRGIWYKMFQMHLISSIFIF